VTCRVYEEQLSSYLDEELPAARASRLEAHLNVCPHCQAELEALGGIATRLRELSNLVEVSHDFDGRVLRAVGYWRVTGWQRPVKSYLKPLVTVAFILLALWAAVWHFFTQPFQPAPAPVPAPAYSVTAPAAPTAAPVPEERDERR
jgi:anti-sigma factor RsiW